MTVRYGNEVLLTDIARQVHNQEHDLQVLLRDGHLDSAFLIAGELAKKLEWLRARLNDIKYGRIP